jgi:hypothetical protein
VPPHHHHHHRGGGSSATPEAAGEPPAGAPTDPRRPPQETPWSQQPGGELRYFTPDQVRLLRHGPLVRMTVVGEYSVLNVTLLRAFPISRPDEYLSLLDEGQKEIGMIAAPLALDAESRAIVAAELARRYRLPEIRQVLEVKERFGTQEWNVATDRGQCVFTTRDLFDNARYTAAGELLITDVDGNRYRIPDLDRLDRQSRLLLDSLV